MSIPTDFREQRAYTKAEREELEHYSRLDVNTFAEYCFGIRQAPVHEDMQRMMTQHKWCVMHSPPDLGKTTQVEFVRPLWEWGRDTIEHGHPVRNFALLSATADIPDSNIEQMANHLQNNERLRAVFPHLRMIDCKQSRTGNKGIWLRRKKGSIERDPHGVSLGVMGNKLGRRVDVLVPDDIHTRDNTRTRARREEVRKRFEEECLSRLNNGGCVWYIGHAWYKDDVGGWLVRHARSAHRVYDVERNLDGTPGSPWPELVTSPEGKQVGWPQERIRARKAITDTITWLAMYRGQPPDEGQELFADRDILVALNHGRNNAFPRKPPPGVFAVSGVDLSTGEGNDETVIVSGSVVNGYVFVLRVDHGVWANAAIFKGIRDALRFFPDHRGFEIETVSAFKFITQTMQRRDVMRAYGWTDLDFARVRFNNWNTTAQNKNDAIVGIRSLAADFNNHRVVLASDEHGQGVPGIDKLVEGFRDYDPTMDTQHTSDYVIAYWLMVERMRRLGLFADRAQLGIS